MINCGIRSVLTVATGTGLKYHPDYIPYHEEILAEDIESQDLSKFYE